MKLLTESEAETKRQQAVEFLRRIGNDEAAERYEDMDAAEYAEHKGAELLENPHRRRGRPMASNKDLQRRVRELEEENSDLQDQLDTIADIVAPEDEGDEADDGEGDDQGED